MFGREVSLERLLLVAQDDARIVGVTERGSAVDGGLDEFSDVDLSIVCVETGYGQLLGGAEELAGRLGPLLTSYFAEHDGEPGLPLLHVDLKFVSQADLDGSAEAGIVLWEREEGSFDGRG